MKCPGIVILVDMILIIMILIDMILVDNGSGFNFINLKERQSKL